ncbi:hypothetical protein NADFUDRAFT_48524 [Nadsonia fulvescens var. elongata DSM 6958]|uniref:Uncharacterized protein n=1 Tax=Nadsonia fulvescens var. elongata DSM 6958 TaxID=857566 RepID=A0A1E3PRA3_9ASCO|nr:hypothetical protein NADFUDRAFT_48524 [Nadsonia fulvescens var. elongata DSM 6958]
MDSLDLTLQSVNERIQEIEHLVGSTLAPLTTPATSPATGMVKHLAAVRDQINGLMASYKPLQEFAQLVTHYRLWTEVRKIANDEPKDQDGGNSLTAEQKLAVIKSLAATPALSTTLSTHVDTMSDYLQDKPPYATPRELAQVAELLPTLLNYVDRVYAVQSQVDQLSVATTELMTRWIKHCVADNEQWIEWEQRLQRVTTELSRAQRQKALEENRI